MSKKMTKMVKKEAAMLKRSTKESLINSFRVTCIHTMVEMENLYGVAGIVENLFGNDIEDAEATAQNFKNSSAWTILSNLYDYAVNGIVNDEPPSIVIDGANVLELASCHDNHVSQEWADLVEMADARLSLEEGGDLTIKRVALLGGVDMRTVRNAISAGDLAATKDDDIVWIEHASTMRWLHSRKGFKPTVYPEARKLSDIAEITSSTAFGAFLAARRKFLGLDAATTPSISGPTRDMATKLESGMFLLPLDAAFPLADFYQINRKDFLEAVMRIFFAEELSILVGK
jgi:hypothetical protein